MSDLPPWSDGTEPPSPYPPAAPFGGTSPADSTPPVSPVASGYIDPSDAAYAYPTYPAASDPGYGNPGYSYPSYGYPSYSYPANSYSAYGYPGSGYPGYAAYDPAALADPLVTPAAQGFVGWWARVWKTFARSWTILVPILLLTSAVPALAFAVFQSRLTAHIDTMVDSSNQFNFGPVGELYGAIGVFMLISAFTNGLGWSACIWAITKAARGESVSLGSALSYGLRKFLRVGGWFLLYELMVVGGTLLCILPGLYLGLAGCLFVPFAIFESAGIGRSFKLVHAHFGAALGRVATLVGLTIGAGLVTAVLGSVVGGVVGGFSGSVASGVIDAVLGVPASAVLIIGIMLTYTELTARQYAVNTNSLDAAL